MAATLLVSGAGLGDREAQIFGGHQIANKTPSLAALGFDAAVGGIPLVSPNVPGRSVNFNFVVAQTQSADMVRLDFDLARPVLVLGWSATLFGTAVVINKSFGAFEQGWLDEGFGAPVISPNVPGRGINFNFTLAWTQPGGNVGMYFDGKPLVAGVTVGDQLRFGQPSLANTARQLWAVSIPPLDPWVSVLFVGRGASLNFNFVLAYTPPSGLNVRLDFDPQRPIAAAGFSATLFGTTVVTNKALGIFPSGASSLVMGSLTTVSFPTLARSLDFNFFEPYTPFTGINVPFPFGERKETKPDGSSFLEFGLPKIAYGVSEYVRPYGWFSYEIGDHMVSNLHRGIANFGWLSSAYGSHLITNRHQAIQPPGFPNLMVNEPVVTNTRRAIVVYPGFDSFRSGLANVKSSIGPDQPIEPDGFDATLWGRSAELPLVAYEFRSIHFELTPSTEQTKYGEHYVGYRIRRILPEGEPYVQWGLPRLEYTPHIFPVGVDNSIFGMAAMSFGNVLAPLGFDAHEMSVYAVEFAKRYLKTVEEKEQATYGIPYVWNLRQYIVEDNSIYFDNAPPFGFDTRIYNRNRHVYPEGVIPPKIERTHRLHNTGRAVAPEGVDSSIFGGTTVWFRIRKVLPTGYVDGFINEYHYVHNYATRVYPEGFDTQEFPTKHMAWFNGQSIVAYGFDRQRFGLPFVSDGVRYVDQQLTTDTLTFGTAWVSANPRYLVELTWKEEILVPSPLVQIHFTIMRPHAIDSKVFGTATIRNVTPQLFPGTFYSMGVGEPWVSRSPRWLTPEGFSLFASPQHAVTYANRPVLVPGINSFVMPRHKIWTEVAGDLDGRIIYPDGIAPPDELGFNGPSLRSNVLYLEGWDSSKFGAAKSDTQGCYTHWYDPDSRYQFGVPSLNPTRTINLNENGIDPTKEPILFSPQRIDPHTIWCRHDTPQQARDNHPESKPWCDMDRGPLCDLPPRPYFGNATVSTPSTQIIAHYHGGQDFDFAIGGWIGEETFVQNQHRRIYVDRGIYTFKPGMQTYLNGPRNLWPEAWDSPEIGKHKLSTPVDNRQWIGPAGWNSFICPKHYADNFNRPIYPEGFSATEWGDNKPMVYHYPRGPKGVSGTDMSVFGPDTWISPYVREIFPEGSEMFEEGYDLGSFKDRLRVTQKKGNIPPSVGDSFRSGLHMVSYGQRAPQYIRPYMIPPPQYCHPHSVEEVV